MSSQELPRTLSVRKAAVSGSLYKGEVGLSQIPRVAAAVLGADAGFLVRLAFAESESGKRTLHAEVSGQAWLQCQRCLQPVSLTVASESTMTIVAHDQEARSSLREHDPLVVTGDELNTYELVEDEILLALPIVALHENSACSVQTMFDGAVTGAEGSVGAEQGTAKGGDAPDFGNRNKPFAVLGDLRSALEKKPKP